MYYMVYTTEGLLEVAIESGSKIVYWVGFEPTSTEFRSDALNDWAIRPRISYFVQCSRFISVIASGSRHICFNWNLWKLMNKVDKDSNKADRASEKKRNVCDL